ncbi:MAG: hypothetical protein KKA42_00230, partial [candidate division Zixibacteria bacterium]|nr:hypothetical protein [candidate division Zixibacteria bacterium]
MGRFICYLVLFVLLSTAGWATPNLFSGPESVAWDSVHNRWLVSNYTAGNVIAVDEYGSLSIFAEGLGNCLGNEIVGNTLYVSTRTTVVGLDLTTGEQIVTIPFTPIQNMDGLAADTSGHLYAIDTGGRLFKINLSDHSTSLFVGWGLASNVQDCTFDEIHNRLLLVIWAASASASIMAVDLPDSTVYPICPNGIGFFDGVVTDGKGNTFAGSYAGTNSVWRWDSTYSDPPTRIAADNEGPAGLAYNRDNDVLAIPNFNANRVRFVNTVADFTADVVLGWPPLEVTFTGSTPDTVDAWSWDFGDGDTDA